MTTLNIGKTIYDYPAGSEEPRMMGTEGCDAYKFTPEILQGFPPFRCDRIKGHEGEHVAHSGGWGRPVFGWKDDRDSGHYYPPYSREQFSRSW